MRYFPEHDFKQHLAQEGLAVPEDGFLIEDRELSETETGLAVYHRQESPERIRQRALYYLVWKHYAIATQVGQPGVDATNVLRTQALNMSHQRLVAEQLPDLATALGWRTRQLSEEIKSGRREVQQHQQQIKEALVQEIEADTAKCQRAILQVVSDEAGNLGRTVDHLGIMNRIYVGELRAEIDAMSRLRADEAAMLSKSME